MTAEDRRMVDAYAAITRWFLALRRNATTAQPEKGPPP